MLIAELLTGRWDLSGGNRILIDEVEVMHDYKYVDFRAQKLFPESAGSPGKIRFSLQPKTMFP